MLAMEVNSHTYKAEMLVTDYILAYSFLPYVSMIAGILMSKMAYDLTHSISSSIFKFYITLPRIQKMEWSNRGMSTIHAIFIATMSLYLVFFSDLYSKDQTRGLITFRSSSLSNFTLGVSVGYFISDLAMIYWSFPLLGGMEFVFHHFLSILSIAYCMFTGQGQAYTFMVLISEATTPGVNLRWFLDTAGKKKSKVYIANGVLLFFEWLAARILLFGYFFYHVFKHYDQVKEMHVYGYLLVFVVPSILAVMNIMWFGKILKGLMKTVAITKVQ